MFRWLYRMARNRSQKKKDPGAISELQAKSVHDLLSSNLHDNIDRIRDLFGNSSDLIVREFSIGDSPTLSAALIQIEGVVDNQFSASAILSSLMVDARLVKPDRRRQSAFDLIYERALTLTGVAKENHLREIGKALPVGDSLLLIDGEATGIICSTRGFKHRAVEEPVTESGVRVPREGFTEALRVNTSLVRRRVRDPRLRFETMQIGAVTQTDVSIAYIDGIVNEGILKEVRRRLQSITVDGILESGYLEDYIQDSPYSIFPLIRRTERPDVIAASILEGRVAIFTAGTPFVLVVPVTLPEFLHASEDYYDRFLIVSFVRFVRYIAFIFSMVGPALYVALVTFHHEMIPPTVLLDLAAAREGVPFPAALEAFFMIFVFEVLREAGIRLPRIVGSAITIVGALVIGEQTVSAGLVSPALVIIIAGTAIASFATPSYGLESSVRLLRIGFLIGASFIGLFGIFLISTAVLLHLCSTRSFGIPYLAPFAPLQVTALQDTVVRVPWWAMFNRPAYLSLREKQRQDIDNQPEP